MRRPPAGRDCPVLVRPFFVRPWIMRSAAVANQGDACVARIGSVADGREASVTYDPEIHHRRSTRAPAHDYAQAGAYFVTICTHNRACILGAIEDSAFVPNDLGDIVVGCWQAIPVHFPSVLLDEFVVMPNHMHGVLFIGGNPESTEVDSRPSQVGARATHASLVQDPGRPSGPGTNSENEVRRVRGPAARSLGAIVGSFKAASSKRINEAHRTAGATIWHRGYHDRIVRNDHELDRIRRYIYDNPAAWPHDEENPAYRR
jgi:REP element-mobilizing transposase RayT